MSTTRVRLSPERRREQLLDLGVHALSDSGLEELSIEMLAEQAGVSRGLMYHYFSSKRDFQLAVLRRMSERLVAMTAPQDDVPPVDRLQASLAAWVDFVAENREAYLSFLRSAKSGDEEYHRIYEESRRALTDRIFTTTDAETLAELGLVDDPRGRLSVLGWSALVEEMTLAWLDDPRGLGRRDLVDVLAACLPAVATAAR